MGTLFALLFFLSPLVLVAGLIKPSLVLPWDKTKTRCRAGLTYSISTVVFFVLAGITLPKTTPQEVVSSPATPSIIPLATPSVASASSWKCKDFVDQADAQESFDNGNRFNLEDNDGDGIACEETSKFGFQAKTAGEIKEPIPEFTYSPEISIGLASEPYVIFVGETAEVWKGEQITEYDDAISGCIAEGLGSVHQVQVFFAIGDDRCEVVDLTEEANSEILTLVNGERATPQPKGSM